MDPFERIAERRFAGARKVVSATAKEKALVERDELFRLWKKQQQKRRDELLKGAYGAEATRLADLLERMTIHDTTALLELVEQGPWRNVDADTRYQVLGMIDRAIIYVRECEGLAPFDDALPGEEPTVFEIIRERLT
jgi:hypothetical protein